MSETEVVEVSPASLPQRQDAGALVQVVASTSDVVAAFHAYQAAKEALLTPADYQTFREGGHERSFVKRSGWRKLAIAFGVSFTIVDKQQMVDDAGMLRYAEFTVRATAPNGRSSDGWGSCSADERCCVPGCTRRHRHCPAADGGTCHPANHFTKPRHDIPATAETRAKNRAAADLFGMGEVSAEEVTEEHPQAISHRMEPSPAASSHSHRYHHCPACGSNVYDNNADVDAEPGSKRPRWKCSNRDCTGGNNGRGWASWDRNPWGDTETPADHAEDTWTPAQRLVEAVTNWEMSVAGGDIPPAEAEALALSVIRGSDALHFVTDSQTVDLETVDVEILRAVYRELHDLYTGPTA